MLSSGFFNALCFRTCLSTIVCCLLFATLFPANAEYSKQEVIEAIGEERGVPAFAYEAEVVSKVHMMNQTVADTGKVVFSPPNKYQVSFPSKGMKVTTIGDTSWSVMPDGSVTRRVGNGNSGMMSAGIQDLTSSSSLSAPDVSAIIKSSEFEIVAETKGTDITIEFHIAGPTGKQKVRSTYDVEEWLVRKMTIYGGMAGAVEIGYDYQQLSGHTLLKEMNMVLGAMGFMSMTYSGYKKTEPKPISFFREW